MTETETDLRAEVSREIALNMALSSSSGDINYNYEDDNGGCAGGCGTDEDEDHNDNNTSSTAVAASSSSAAVSDSSSSGRGASEHSRRQEEEEEDLKAKERARAATARATSQGSHQGEEEHHRQEEEGNLNVGVGIPVPPPPIPAPMRVGAYCHTPGSKSCGERRQPIRYDSLRGHLTASSTDTSATSITSTSTACSNGGRTTSTGSTCPPLPDDRLELERRKTLLTSLNELSKQCLQEEEEVEVEEEQVEQEEDKNEGRAENAEVSADQLPTPGVPRAASMPGTTTTAISQQQHHQQQDFKSKVETTTPQQQLQLQEQEEIVKGEKPTTTTTSNSETHQDNTSKTLEEAEDDDDDNFCFEGCLDRSGSDVDDTIPIAAKLAFNETESEMFNRIKDIVLQEESQRYCMSSITTIDRSAPIHLAEAIILPAEGSEHCGNSSIRSHHTVQQQEEKIELKRRRKRQCILLVVLVVLFILVLLGALIVVAVGRTNTTTTATTTATSTTDTSSSPLGEEEEHAKDNLPLSSTQPPQSLPPQPAATTTNAIPSYSSQCVLLNYPQVVAFNQTQRQDDTIISTQGPVPETICQERVPLMQKSIYCQEKQIQGSGVTNLVAQSQVWWYQQNRGDDEQPDDNDNAVLSLVNAGFIKSDICQGDYTMEMAKVLLPYDSRMVVLPQVQGSTLVAILEEALEVLWVGFQNGLNSGGGYPYAGGGLRFDVNMTASFPHRLSNVQVQVQQHKRQQNNSHLRRRRRLETEDSVPDATDDDDWIPLDLTSNYTLITNSYLVDGGDGYSVLSDAYAQEGGGQDLGERVRDSFIQYSQQHLLQNPPLAEYSTQTYIHDPIMF